MRLSDLIGGSAQGAPPIDIRGIAADSRSVRPGYLFAALPGTKTDGGRFVADAIKAGAVAVLAAEGAALGEVAGSVALVTDANPRRRLAEIAARFHGRQPSTVAAVTGTSGKTSTVWFLREIWSALGDKAASLGTLGIVSAAGRRGASLTTPDPVALHATLAALVGEGIEHVAIEASSHGLDQFRLDGVAIKAAAFTNLARDHLDYHPSVEHYFQAKRRLFAELLAPGRAAVLNTDDPEFSRIAATSTERRQRIIRFGRAAGAELRLISRKVVGQGQALDIEVFGVRHAIDLPLFGDFQAMNALAAAGLAIGCGAEPGAVVATLSRLSGVPGRMEIVARRASGAPIIVDYAHKPDALAAVLRNLRPHAERRLGVVFGCGGDRDKGKRPEMGKIAQDMADAVWVTDDNPRTEDAAGIRAAILAACPKAVEIGDRRRAIETAIAALGAGDILVVAGKGHESGQIVGRETKPFDDAAVARAAVEGLGEAQR